MKMAGRFFVAAGLLLALACWQGQAAGDKPGDKPDATSATSGDNVVKLTYEANEQVAGIFTPRKLVDKVGFQFFAGKGDITVAGKSVALVGVLAGRKEGLGVDTNGNGEVDAKEILAVPRNRTLLFRIKGEGKKEFAIIVNRCELTSMQGGAVRVSGDYYAACGLKGTLGKTQVRIIDDNLDGKITQDGNDAIAIGNSVCAQPLGKVHQVGGAFYELEVNPDGSSLRYTKIEDLKPVKVTSPLLKKGVLRSLVLTNEKDGQVFDLVLCKSGIPAGEYTLAYGALEAGKDVVIIKPGSNTKPISVGEAGGDIGLGPPLKLVFTAFAQAGEVKVQPEVVIVGAAGEIYQPDFGSTNGRPTVTLSEGSRVISRKAMEYG